MEQQASEKNYIYRPRFGNEADIARLIEQHKALSQVIKLFPPAFQPQGDETLLDIGCGPGSWAIDVAFHYPDMPIIGIDIDPGAIEYATLRAKTEHTENISFEVADATDTLPCRDNSVDYINIRFAQSFLLKNQWSRLFAECQRVLRPGGWLRSVEAQDIQSSSLAGYKLWTLQIQASEKDGRRFLKLAPFLTPLLKQAGLIPQPLAVDVVDFSEGTPAHKALCDDWLVSAHLATPFIIRQGIASEEEVNYLIEGMQKDMMLPDFYSLIFFTDIAAQKPL